MVSKRAKVCVAYMRDWMPPMLGTSILLFLTFGFFWVIGLLLGDPWREFWDDAMAFGMSLSLLAFLIIVAGSFGVCFATPERERKLTLRFLEMKTNKPLRELDRAE